MARFAQSDIQAIASGKARFLRENAMEYDDHSIVISSDRAVLSKIADPKYLVVCWAPDNDPLINQCMEHIRAYNELLEPNPYFMKNIIQCDRDYL